MKKLDALSRQQERLLELHRLHDGLYARVAHRLGVDPSYVSRVARDERQSPKVKAALVADLLVIEKQRRQISRFAA
jgi:transcriptional regulator with XRE-family HTH domain